MASMNVFKSSLFNMTSLTGYVNKMPHVPQVLGEMNLFQEESTRTEDIFVEENNGRLNLVPSTERGSPSTKVDGDKRRGTSFKTVRLSQQARISSHEVQGIRADNSEMEMRSVQMEVEKRRRKLELNLSLTEEYHRLGAINGLLLDADGTTVIEDFFDAFNLTRPTATAYNFGSATFNVRDTTRGITRSIMRAGKGAVLLTSKIVALCGDDFYDALTSHPTVKPVFDNWNAKVAFREETGPFQEFYLDGVYWRNYRGTDDNSTVAIPADECRFVVSGGNEIFKHVLAPSEGWSQVSQLGVRRYADIVMDKDRSDPRFADLFLDSYPLFINQRPDLLRIGRAT